MNFSERTPYQVTFIVVLSAVFAFTIMGSMVIPVLYQLQGLLGTDQSGVTWILTANLISAAICTPILGRVGDAVGKGRTLTAILIALSIGALIAALATNLQTMLVARVIQGAGGATMPLAFGIIRDEFPARKMPFAVSVTSAFIGVGSALGIVMSGPLVDLLGLRALFWLPMGITAITAVLAAVLVPPSPVRSPGGSAPCPPCGSPVGSSRSSLRSVRANHGDGRRRSSSPCSHPGSRW